MALPKYTVPSLTAQQGADVAAVLQQRLDALNDLALTLKHIHWNVVGPHFIAVHEMIDPQVDAVRAMEEASGVRLEELRADGGATANGWMLQFQADLLGVPVVVPEISETTALGAAYLAGVAAGTWSEADVRAMWTEAARYEPSMADDQRGELMDGWQRAVTTTRNHSA